MVSQYENGPDFQTPNEARIADLEGINANMLAALRNIAEGNLGDAPWQANYDKIRTVASDAVRAHEDGGRVGRSAPDDSLYTDILLERLPKIAAAINKLDWRSSAQEVGMAAHTIRALVSQRDAWKKYADAGMAEYTRAENAEVKVCGLERMVRWAHDTLHEIGSPNDYTDLSEVAKLNDASVEVILGLAQCLGERHGHSEAWWADYRSKHPLPTGEVKP